MFTLRHGEVLMFRPLRSTSTAEVTAIELGRNRTANGGWEWFLVLEGEPVYGPGGVGFFSDPECRPIDALNTLLRIHSNTVRS